MKKIEVFNYRYLWASTDYTLIVIFKLWCNILRSSRSMKRSFIHRWLKFIQIYSRSLFRTKWEIIIDFLPRLEILWFFQTALKMHKILKVSLNQFFYNKILYSQNVEWFVVKIIYDYPSNPIHPIILRLVSSDRKCTRISTNFFRFLVKFGFGYV